MPDVLGLSGGAEVSFSVVEAIVVDVVGVEVRWEVEDKVVHTEVFAFFFFAVCEGVDGIAGVSADVEVPFVFAYSVEIIGVNDGEFALRERDASEGAAIA